MLIEADPSKYHFINQGMLTVDNVNDADEMKSTKKAFDTLGFTQVVFITLYLKLWLNLSYSLTFLTNKIGPAVGSIQKHSCHSNIWQHSMETEAKR